MSDNKKDMLKMGIYTGISDYTVIPAKLLKLFKPVSKSIDLLHDIFGSEDENNIRFNLKDGTNIVFNVKRNKQFVLEHTIGMAEFYKNIHSFKPQVQNNVIKQIKTFKEIVFCYFDKSTDEYKNAYITKAIFDTAAEARGYIVTPSMYIYHPSKKILFGADGGSDYDEFTPLDYDIVDKEMDEERLKNL